MRIRQPIGGDFAISGDLVNRYLELNTFNELAARFGIDIWMTHSAINEGFAICQARLGAKIHDAKDPASDLGPMFRQVVGTLFGLAGHYAERWLRVRGSHPIPEYGFERVVAPEPITVNHAKLVDAFDSARPTHGPAWAEILAPEQLERVMSLEATDDPATFHFPSELWVRCLYDALVAYQRPETDRERLLAALTPLYFGRTAGFISDTLELIGPLSSALPDPAFAAGSDVRSMPVTGSTAVVDNSRYAYMVIASLNRDTTNLNQTQRLSAVRIDYTYNVALPAVVR